MCDELLERDRLEKVPVQKITRDGLGSQMLHLDVSAEQRCLPYVGERFGLRESLGECEDPQSVRKTFLAEDYA